MAARSSNGKSPISAENPTSAAIKVFRKKRFPHCEDEELWNVGWAAQFSPFGLIPKPTRGNAVLARDACYAEAYTVAHFALHSLTVSVKARNYTLGKT